MSVTITKSALNLRALLAKLANLKPAPEYRMHWFSGNGSTTAFALPVGWRYVWASVDGSVKRDGKGEAFTATTVEGVQTLTFAVAPGSVSVGVFAVRESVA